MTNKDKAANLLTRLELILLKDIPLTPEKMLEEFGAEDVGFFYEKILGVGDNYGSV